MKRHVRFTAAVMAGVLIMSSTLSGCVVTDAFQYVFRGPAAIIETVKEVLERHRSGNTDSEAQESSAAETEAASDETEGSQTLVPSDEYTENEPLSDTGFYEFTNEVIGELLQDNTLNVHYYLYNAENYGLDPYEATWGDLGGDEESSQEYREYLDDLETRLHSFDRSELNWEERYTYDILENYIALERTADGLDLYYEPLSASNGIQSALPVELAEYNFYTEEDAETYIELCRQLPDYFQEVLEYEQLKADAGLFMEDDVLEDVIDQCNEFIEGKEDSFLYDTFEERLLQLDLTDTRRAELIEENKEGVEAIYQAYEELAAGLEKMKGLGKYEGGLCNYPDGKAYYTYKIASSTGSSKTPEEMITLLENTIKEDISYLSSCSNSVYYKAQSFEYPSTDPNLIMRMLIEACADEYPELEDVDYSVKYVDESLRDYLSPAFYLITPIDADTTNYIYINSDKGEEEEDLFVTLAHEGYPGHLYQSNFLKQNSDIELRQVLSTTGFEEGWAEYVELGSYAMIDGIDPDVAGLLSRNSEATLCIYGRTDLGIHYEGWDVNDVYSYFTQYFDIDMDDAEWIYTYILGDPGGYLDYIVGALEIQELKEEAEQAENYSPLVFNSSVLVLSGAPFDLIRQYMFEE